MNRIDWGEMLDTKGNTRITWANHLGDDEFVQVVGRVVFVRTFGKLTFVVIRDAADSIQVGLRGKMDPPPMWSIISVHGTTGKTKKGEHTVWAEEYTLLAECNGGRPDKYHGIENPEYIHHKRYAHLIANPDQSHNLMMRSRIIREIRRRLEDVHAFMEVETPLLSDRPTGANAQPFVTHHNAENRDKYLRIALEVPLKKAIIAGFPSVFEIGRVFRNEGVDRTHRPEFTMVEMYKSNGAIEDMRDLFIDLIHHLTGKCPDMPTYEYDDLVAKYGEDFDEHMQELCFVVGQPLEQTPLCKARPDGKADRFEVFGRGFEIANAFQEVHTADEQRERFEGKPEGADDGLIEALEYGMPPTSGMGIGIDRLVMYLLKIDNVRDAILFP